MTKLVDDDFTFHPSPGQSLSFDSSLSAEKAFLVTRPPVSSEE
jgi:hypothetical protein